MAFVFTAGSDSFAKPDKVIDYEDSGKLPVWAQSYKTSKSLSVLETLQSKRIRIKNKFNKIRSSYGENAEIPVIIKLKEDFMPEGFLSGVSARSQRDKIQKAQKRIESKLSHRKEMLGKIKKFQTIPYMSIKVSASDIEELLATDEVEDIYEDELVPVHMGESNPLINADDAWGMGYSGNGQTVAVLDTGVDKTHPFLAGKVVSEACYSNGGGSGVSVCPGGVKTSTASGSGVNCSGSIDGCDHGTHVAGTIAGNNGSIYGVAKDAKIIAIQVFTNFSNEALSYSSDQIKGLERVYALRDTYDIASVNMSLGGGKYTGYCDSDSRKAIIDNLRSAGIATVISSGNDGYTNAVGAPGCISSAITVGSTQDGSYGTTADNVSGFSNSAYMLDLFAPGQYITSSVPGTGYSVKMGTSMAAPHVAGAFAVMKSLEPTLTIDEIELALEGNGELVTDSKNIAITKPRINLEATIQSLGTGSITVNISPAGAVSDGAQWKIDSGDWQDSGVTVTNVPIGTHTITYKSVINSNSAKLWQTPASSSVSLASDGGTATATGNYIESDKVDIKYDLDGDTNSDLVFKHNSMGRHFLAQINGSVYNGASLITNSDGDIFAINNDLWDSMGLTDVDGDGKSDLLFRHTVNGRVYILLMDGNEYKAAGLLSDENGEIMEISYDYWRSVGFADMNNDGKNDIIFRHIYTGRLFIAFLDGTRYIDKSLVTNNDGDILEISYSAWKVVDVADMDGDGYKDIVFHHRSTGRLFIATMERDKFTSSQLITDSSLTPFSANVNSWQPIGLADMSGDGKSDIILRNIVNGSLFILTMNGSQYTKSGLVKYPDDSVIYISYVYWRSIAFADVDGDGVSEIYFRNIGNGRVMFSKIDDYVYQSTTLMKDADDNILEISMSAWTNVNDPR